MYETFHQLSSSTDEKNESRSFIVLLVAIGSEYVWVFVNRGGLRISTRAPTLTPSHTRRSADCHYSHVLTHEALCCQSKRRPSGHSCTTTTRTFPAHLDVDTSALAVEGAGDAGEREAGH
ncbi:hypothetical protein O3P69_011389 [Scylla paramamosain]|uniref:Uncharacterized protein n=1 Tax=Scylla paramamosain TaxID=85552 RepID=A0AAW0T8X0_SCYPA